MTADAIVKTVTGWAHRGRAEVGLWVETEGMHWHAPNAHVTALNIVGPDFTRMQLVLRPAEITLTDLMRVLDVLDRCQLWSPDAHETSCWMLAKLQRLPHFYGCTTTFARLLQDDSPRPAGRELETHQELRLRLLDAGQSAVIMLEMQALRALARAEVGGYYSDQWGTQFPVWRSVHESGNPMPIASGPPLNSTRKDERNRYVAPLGYRWMQIRYPQLAGCVLAALADESKLFMDLPSISDDERNQLQIFLRQGPTMTPGDLTEWGAFGASLLPLGAHLESVVKRVEESGVVASLLNRRWVWRASQHTSADPHEQRRITAAYIGHSAATVLKMAMVKLAHAAEEQPRRAFLGFSQLLPHYESISYLIDERVPFDRHCDSVQSLMTLSFGTANSEQLWILQPRLYVGPSWGDLVPADDPNALARIDLARPVPEVLRCDECGQTTTSPLALATHKLEEHGASGVAHV